jgi:Ras-related protein Rab-8A
LEQKKIKLQIWDTAGQERFRFITKTYYKGANGIIITFDLTNEDSFKNIKYWIKNIEQYSDYKVCKILVGNKSDREEDRIISFEEGSKLAEQYDMKYIETSAKDNKNIYKTFSCIAKEILDNIEGNIPTSDSIVLDNYRNEKNTKKGNCC